MNDLQQEVMDWVDSVHPHRTPQGTLLKLFEEIGEIARDPADSMEYADVMIVLLDLAAQNHITGDELIERVRQKMAINRDRTWSINNMGVMNNGGN